MHPLLASTCSFLDQARSPPPSLREVLGAYNTKGDGDRDMLLAVLNAKTAEDQRLASVASLQRTVLELIDLYPPSPSNLPVTHQQVPSQSQSQPRTRPRRSSPSSSPQQRSAPLSRSSRTRTSTTLPPRKRPRPSRSPAPSASSTVRPRATINVAVKPDPEESLSPHSSPNENPSASPLPSRSSNESTEYSPRTRTSMAIGSLLSSRQDSQGGVHGNPAPSGKTSL